MGTCLLLSACTQNHHFAEDPNLAAYPFDSYECADFTVKATTQSFHRRLPEPEQYIPADFQPIAGTVSHHALASDWINAFFHDLAEARDIDTFIIISPRHYAQGSSYISISPLPWLVDNEVVEVNQRFYDRFSQTLGLNADPWAFAGEHGIETLLPYIVHYFPDAEIMPILQKEKPLRLDILNALSGTVQEIMDDDEGAFLLISSDFSHHEGIEITHARDTRSRIFLEVIPDAFLGMLGCDNIGGMSVLQDTLQTKNYVQTVIRNHSDSLEISGEQEWDITSYFFSYFVVPETDIRKELTRAVRKSVRKGFRDSAPPEFKDYPYTDADEGIAVRFRSGNAERGCIAYYKGVSDFKTAAASAARNAAFSDGRYPPIRRDELKDLTVEISLIGAGCRMNSPLDFVPGRHSLLLNGPGGRAFMQASVAAQNNMTREDFLNAVTRKAGLDAESWRKPEYELIRYPTNYFTENFRGSAAQ